MYIESSENKKIKLWSALLTKKGRQKEKKFLLESIRGIEEGLKGGVKPEYLLLKEGMKLPAALDSLEVFLVILKEEVFEKLSQTQNSQGVIGVYSFLSYKFKDMLKGQLLFLDGIQDPGNLGTIIRTGAALSLDGLILGPGCVELYNDKVLRSSLGGIFSLPIINADYEDLKLYKKRGFQIIGMDLKGESLKDFTFGKKVIAVIGNENQGISKEIGEILDHRVSIPISERMESLNAGVAAAILMFKLIG